MITGNEPAMPTPNGYEDKDIDGRTMVTTIKGKGLTIHQYFSIEAMKGILSQMQFKDVPIHEEILRIVDSSVVYATALIGRLNKEK